MKLGRALATIGSWTLLSRVLGFARDILIARYLGAGFASDCFNAAFRLPNLFRSLFAEGAFSSAFVPAFAREMREDVGGLEAARRFAEDVLAVFIPALLIFSIIAQILMPWIVQGLFGGFADTLGKINFTIYLCRLTFPYLMLISLAALLGGILNSLSKFSAMAAAPIFLNLSLITAVLIWQPGGAIASDQKTTATAQAIAVSIAGILQFGLLLWSCHRAGVTLKLRLPRLNDKVKNMLRVIVPAAIGSGVYQVSQFINSFFASHLPQGAMSHLFYADRLNQLPLGIVGIALGTAILPTISRHIADNNSAAANDVHNRAAEIALLVCLPATAALAICALPLTQTFFLHGAFTQEDARWTAQALIGLVIGLPAYVLIRVLTPGFFARGDTKTPVKTAAVGLGINIILNVIVMDRFHVLGLAVATAIGAWVNCSLLYYVLHSQGHVIADAQFKKRLVRQLLATMVMAAIVGTLVYLLQSNFVGTLHTRIVTLAIIVVSGIISYLGVGASVGAFDNAQLKTVLRRKSK
jgi:putative peptidoglycan lipid II flippase